MKLPMVFNTHSMIHVMVTNYRCSKDILDTIYSIQAVILAHCILHLPVVHTVVVVRKQF